MLHRDSEVQGVNIVNKFLPVSTTISIISTLPVGTTTNTSLVKVVGWVCWVHYAWTTLGKQVRISGFPVVFFPVDATTDKSESNLSILGTSSTYSALAWFFTIFFISQVVLAQ